MEVYKPINCNFHSRLEHFATLGSFCKIQFYTDINEFITVQAIIKNLYTNVGEEFMELSTGEVIRLDRIVRVNNHAAPQYDEDYFKCDC
jgi:Rho-binding antiterminator